MNHHRSHQGVVSSPTDNLVQRFPRIFHSVQLFQQAFALNEKMLYEVDMCSAEILLKYYSYALGSYWFDMLNRRIHSARLHYTIL